MKNNIKNIFRSALFLSFIGMVATSCNDQLTEEPYGQYDVKGFFKDTQNLRMAVNGVYETFSTTATYGQNWMVYDTDTDISHVQGAGIGHVARDLGHYNAYAEHSWLQDSWTTYYRGINSANTVLENKDIVALEKNPKDTIVFKQLVAETKCLRAMSYFDLTLLFGDVPLKLASTKPGDLMYLGRTDRALVYDQIIKDFEEAIPDMQWSVENERISKGAAMGLLARAYLFRGGYSLYGTGTALGEMRRPANYLEYYKKAQSVLTELMNSNKHGLIQGDATMDGYQKVFRNMCELKYDPFENMCEIAFFKTPNQSAGSGVWGTYNGPAISDKSRYGRANSFIKTHEFFGDLFESGDLRKATAIGDFTIDENNVIKLIKQGPDSRGRMGATYTWAPGKWRRNWHTGAFKDNNATDVNCVILRYADVLLMRAEVENELNGAPNDIAFECINQVRRRAFGRPYLTPAAGFDITSSMLDTKEKFFKYLVDERARELCFEGMRRMDLIRWNKLGDAIKQTSDKFVRVFGKSYSFDAGLKFTSGKHELYPIPAREIRETKGALVQNPGY